MSSFPAVNTKPVPLAIISLNRIKRQCISHLSIHARHKLNDKAFGYLKRVIVTPAVNPHLIK